MPIYGGDEISAIVLDPGSSTTRAGWAGEDTPRALFSTTYGWLPAEASDLDQGTAGEDAMQGVDTADGTNGHLDGNAKGKRKDDGRRRFVGDTGVSVWRDSMELANPLEDGVLSDPSAFLSQATHAFGRILGANTRDHPLLLTEPAWNTKEAREEAIEAAFEGLEVPAFYLANQTVLSAFAAGKGTALVLDVGESNASAIPVVDGFILRKGIHRQPTGGGAVSRALLHALQNPPSGSAREPIKITPQYLVKSKVAVDPGRPAQVHLREDRVKNTTESFRNFHEMRVIHDMKEAVGQVLEAPWDEGQAAARPTKMYEFPDGYNDAFGIERFRAPEVMFDPSIWADVPTVLPPPAVSARPYAPLPQLVLDAISATDVDSRPALLGNIVCVGGGTCLPGFADRLSYELGVRAPGHKIKLHAPGNNIERRYSSWLGGSILASLGTFHQLWISKQEYEEHGRHIVHARCK